MARIIKRGEEYYVEFYGNGLLFQKYAGKDKSEAEKILDEIKTSLPKGAMSNVVLDQGLDEFSSQYLQFARKKYSTVSLKQFESALKLFKPYFKKKLNTLSKITPKVVELYRDDLIKKGKDETEANYQTFLLGCILDFAIKRSYLNDNPTLHVKYLQTKEPATLEREKLTKLIKGSDAKDQLIIKFLIDEAPLDERLKLLKWGDLKDTALKNTFIKKLLDSHVPLIKIYEIFGLDDLRELKPYTCWIRSKITQ